MWQDGNILKTPKTRTTRPDEKNKSENCVENIKNCRYYRYGQCINQFRHIICHVLLSTRTSDFHFILLKQRREAKFGCRCLVNTYLPQDWSWNAGDWSWLRWWSSKSWSRWRSEKGWRGSCSGDSAFLYKTIEVKIIFGVTFWGLTWNKWILSWPRGELLD